MPIPNIQTWLKECFGNKRAPVKIKRRKIEWINEESFQLRNNYTVKQSPNTLDTKRYIISADINNIYSGLGCMLQILLPAWIYASMTHRTLIIDWRSNPYTRDMPEKNLFPLLFETNCLEQLGTPCITNDSIGEIPLPQPILGPTRPFTDESGKSYHMGNGGISKTKMITILRKNEDVPALTFIPTLNSCFQLTNQFNYNSEQPAYTLEQARTFYRALKPVPRWLNLINSFYNAHFIEKPVIGIHVRHGNGEEKYRDHFSQRVIEDFESFIKMLAERIKSIAHQQFGDNYKVFLCTDSDIVSDALSPYFTDFITRDIWRPAPGEGIDFDAAYKMAKGSESAGNALVDIWLLSKCNLVIKTRKTAFLSPLPYLMDRPDAIVDAFDIN